MSVGNSSYYSDVVTSGVQGVVAVGGTPVELKAGGSRLSGRQILVIYNDGIAPIYTGPSASVSTSGANKGMPLFSNQERIIPIGETPIYAVTNGATSHILVQEYA